MEKNHTHLEAEGEVPLQMYAVSGFGDPNTEKYVKACNRENERLQSFILPQNVALCSSDDERGKLIKNALLSNDIFS